MPARHRLLPVAATFLFLAACSSTPASTPTSTTPVSPVPASPATPAAIPSAPPSTVPAVATPSRATATKPSNRTTEAVDCPSAKSLEKLADLPKGWHFRASTVQCWKGWATADPVGPSQGDGFYLFQHKPGQGWRYHSQGSGYHCRDLGITEAAPFCQYP